MGENTEPAQDGGDELTWSVRSFIYKWLVEHERPPSAAETAAGLSIDLGQAQDAYRRLHERHAILLEPGSLTIRIANPFSGVPTGFRVHVGDHAYWANCAWDALGIPAALGADARIEAECADTHTPTVIVVEHGGVGGHGEMINFPSPFRRWYDDLIRT